MSHQSSYSSSKQNRNFGRSAYTGKKPKDTKKTILRLLNFIGEHKPLLFLSIFFTVISVIVNSITPAYLGNSITDYLEKSLNIPVFVYRMGILVLIYLSGYVTSTLSGVALTYMGNKVLFKMRSIFFEKVQKLSIAYFDKSGIGDVISRLTNDIDTIQRFLNNGFISLVSGILTIVFILVAMFSLNLTLTLAMLITFPIMAFITVFLGKKIRKAAKNNQEQLGNLSTKIEESVTGMKIIQSFHKEKEEYESFEKVNAQSRDAHIILESISFVLMPLMSFINIIALVIIIGFGGILVIKYPDVYSVGLLTSFILYARRFFEPLRQLSQVYNSLQSALAGSERVFEILDSQSFLEVSVNAKIIDKINGKVEFKNVNFGYEPENLVLQNISFSINAGEIIAIIGPTGAGKTTIINLLSRFYDTTSGEISIDNIPIKNLDLSSYRQQLGIVLQEPFFFATTIRENILYGKPDATEEEIIAAAKITNVHHFISRLPKGYDTELSEMGTNISQGERQLLAITRTILRNPSILIMDEATSNIDSLTERYIQDVMVKLMHGRTSFIIAHRLSTIKNADRIIVINNHRIVEEGKHQDLYDKKGYYYELLKSSYIQGQL
jgi:ATP-binding cassette subfamily B protein